MKIRSYVRSRRASALGSNTRAFTLVEIMVVSALFFLLLAGLIGAQMFGLRLNLISQTKLSATASARNALSRVRDEVRSGKILYVGNGNASSFTHIADDVPRLGNALMICASTNTNNYVLYFRDPADSCLKRITNGSPRVEMLASYITNQYVFQAEDYRGLALTNDQNNRVIRMTLQFYQWEYPVARVGSGGMYDYYQLQTRITRRLIE